MLKSEPINTYMKLILVFTLAVFSATSSLAQYSETIVSDRPGQGNSPMTVGKGIVQLQSGFGYTSLFDAGYYRPSPYADNDFYRDDYELNKVIRVGVFKKFELSTGLAYQHSELNVTHYGRTRTYVNHGLSRMSVSARYNLLTGDGWKPNLGIQGSINLPWQHESLGANYTFSTFALMGTISPTEKLSVLANVGLTDLWKDFEYAYGFYVFNVGYQLHPKLSLFAEIYGDIIDDELTYKFDGGVAYLINKNLQLDFFGGYDRDSYYGWREWFVNLGISWRIKARR